MRRVFFSFHYQNDIFRVNQIRNSWVVRGENETQPFVDKAEFEQIKRSGPAAIRNWIDSQMKGTSVTVVLIGTQTFSRPWVKYEIEKTHREGRGMIGIDMSGMKDINGNIEWMRGPSPFDYANIGNRGLASFFRPIYPTYSWVHDNGRANIRTWIENAAVSSGLLARL